MNGLSALLVERQMKTAVVIDDAFDERPRASDLDEEKWSVFLDDLDEGDDQRLAAAYPGFEKASPEDLRGSDDFVAALWAGRTQLADIVGDLFAEYESTNSGERAKLEALLTALRAVGLECTPMGRDPEIQKAHTADIVFVDLFLGFSQADADMSRAIDRVMTLVKGREQSPPLIVLMSRSPRLMDKRNEFRDKAGLLASAFRVATKSELEADGAVERILTRLVRPYEDTKRIASFIQAWDNRLDEAKARFVGIVRRLELADFAQIRDLLLAFEGERLGRYVLDICDGVLRHEIEADTATVTAAKALNSINLDDYPAPHLIGTSDLQDLVFRMTFQHPERVRLSDGGPDSVVEFGDVLRWQDAATKVVSNKVSLVITPACDLVRDGARQILLLTGNLRPLDPSGWLYSSKRMRTPIVILADGRFWIEWDLKAAESKTPTELAALLGTDLTRVARLREMYTIELQQRFVADLGRVGQPANPPATFPVTVTFFSVSDTGQARPITIADMGPSACYVGRDKDAKQMQRLVLSEQVSDSIERAVTALDENTLHTSARMALRALKADQGFFATLRVEVPAEGGGPKQVKGAGESIYAYVFRNGPIGEGFNVEGQKRKAPLLINIGDVPEELHEPVAPTAAPT